MRRGLRLEAGIRALQIWAIEAKPEAAALPMQIAQLALQHQQTPAASTAMPLCCLRIAHLLAHQEQLIQAKQG